MLRHILVLLSPNILLRLFKRIQALSQLDKLPSACEKSGLGESWVLGLETDFQGSEINNHFSKIAPYFGPTFFDARQGIDYFGTVRGRIGYATGNMLIYGTGGFAYGNVITKIRLSNLGFTNFLRSDETEAGYAVGTGGNAVTSPFSLLTAIRLPIVPITRCQRLFEGRARRALAQSSALPTSC
jgi:hypothetical protein